MPTKGGSSLTHSWKVTSWYPSSLKASNCLPDRLAYRFAGKCPFQEVSSHRDYKSFVLKFCSSPQLLMQLKCVSFRCFFALLRPSWGNLDRRYLLLRLALVSAIFSFEQRLSFSSKLSKDPTPNQSPSRQAYHQVRQSRSFRIPRLMACQYRGTHASLVCPRFAVS